MAHHHLLDHLFTSQQVVAVTGLSEGKLKGILDRKQVDLGPAHYPGSGRPRVFHGGDLVKLRAARVMSDLGLPLRQVSDVADIVSRRITTRLGSVDPGRLWVAIYSTSKGNWHIATGWKALDDHQLPVEIFESWPAAVQLLNVDRFIDETLARLLAAKSGWSISSLDGLDHIYGRWVNDNDRRQCLVGLSFDETMELSTLKDRAYGNISGMDLWGLDAEEVKAKLRHGRVESHCPSPYPWIGERDFEQATARVDELDARHEAAWLARLKVEIGKGADQ